MGEPPLLEVGTIVRAHGVRGEVVVALLTDRSERLDPGFVLWSDAGPLTVESSRPHQQRHLVRFEGVATRDDAARLAGVVLRAEATDDDNELWVHRLIGSAVVTVSGTAAGVVDAVEANPASDLLVLSSGALVPVVFVIEQRSDGTVVIDPPEGLLDT